MIQNSNSNTETNIVCDDKYRSMDYAIKLLASWLSKNECDIVDVQKYIIKTYRTVLSQLEQRSSNTVFSADMETKDIVDVTVFPDYLICLEDGKKLKMLKRHLQSKYHMSLDEYKRRWNLPYDYPVVAPNYAQKRSFIAKQTRKPMRKNHIAQHA